MSAVSAALWLPFYFVFGGGMVGQDGDSFFGEPMPDIENWMQTDARTGGVIDILAADGLPAALRLLWMQFYIHGMKRMK